MVINGEVQGVTVSDAAMRRQLFSHHIRITGLDFGVELRNGPRPMVGISLLF